MSFWKNRLDQNTNEKFDRFCPLYLLGRIYQIFRWYFGPKDFSKRHFEINWPLAVGSKTFWICFGFLFLHGDRYKLACFWVGITTLYSFFFESQKNNSSNQSMAQFFFVLRAAPSTWFEATESGLSRIWNLLISRTYNKFSTCFHESWIYKTRSFSIKFGVCFDLF